MHGDHGHSASELDSYKNFFKRIFELDLRSLAVARIALGFLIFLDCIFRLENFEAHYTEFGIMPLNILYTLYKPNGPCIHCWMSSDSWVALVFAVHAIFALLFMLGWKTRISNFFVWILCVSLQYRNPLIIDGGDVLLRCFLLWMFFLPVGEYFSLDARKKKPTATHTVWWINIILPLQLFMLYFASALLKTGQDWWPLGTATGYALSLEAFVTPFGRWLTQFPETLKVVTRCVFLTELWGPFLLLCSGRWRAAGVLVFIGFHAGLGLAMDLALFPWIAFACLFTLMPSEFWELVKKPSLPKNFSRPKVQTALSVLAVPYFLLAVSWNVYSYYKKPLPKVVSDAALFIHVDQYWGMFAPYPLKDSGWYEFGVQLWNGEYLYTFIDSQMEAQWDDKNERPHNGYLYFVDQRWKKYLINLWDRNNAKFRPFLATYLCRKWNRENQSPSQRATQLDMEFTLFENKEYLMPARGPSSINLGTYDCPP